MNRKARHAIWEQIEHRMGVCCFTQHPDNLLMWGHYGDKFRGICQVFDLPESGVGDAFIQDVNYSDEYPHVLLDMGDSEVFSNLTQAVATKAKCWCYEDEYRLIKNGGPGLITLPRNCFRAIILGPLMPKQRKLEIRSLVESSEVEIVTLEAQIEMGHYRVEVPGLD